MKTIPLDSLSAGESARFQQISGAREERKAPGVGRVVLQFVVFLAAGIVALVIWQRFLRPAEPVAHGAASPALAARERAGDAPRAEQSRIVVIREPAAAPSAAPAEPQPEALVDEEASFGPPLQPDEMQPQLEATLSREPKDQAWARNAEQNLTAKVRGVLPEGSRVLEVQCQSSLCRMRLDHRAVGTHDSLVRLLPETRPWNGAIYLAPPVVKDGVVESDIFIAREGYPLEGIAE